MGGGCCVHGDPFHRWVFADTDRPDFRRARPGHSTFSEVAEKTALTAKTLGAPGRISKMPPRPASAPAVSCENPPPPADMPVNSTRPRGSGILEHEQGTGSAALAPRPVWPRSTATARRGCSISSGSSKREGYALEARTGRRHYFGPDAGAELPTRPSPAATVDAHASAMPGSCGIAGR